MHDRHLEKSHPLLVSLPLLPNTHETPSRIRSLSDLVSGCPYHVHLSRTKAQLLLILVKDTPSCAEDAAGCHCQPLTFAPFTYPFATHIVPGYPPPPMPLWSSSVQRRCHAVQPCSLSMEPSRKWVLPCMRRLVTLTPRAHPL